jgi:hypothetical protein
MASQSDDINSQDKQIIARSLLKHAGVKVSRERDRYVFVIPADKAEQIKKEFGFSFEQLRVGGDIPLPELAVHVDEQAALEASVSLVCEIARHKLEELKNRYQLWQEELYYTCKCHLQDNVAKPRESVTENTVRGYMAKKYKEKIREWQKQISDLEFQYRLLNNVFRAAVITKGALLPTLRNIVQGKSAGIEVVNQEKARIKLKV